MMDFFFFVKTLILTLFVVLLLQIEVDKKTVEGHLHDWMEGSLAAGFLGNAAHGGAHFLHDATQKISNQMKEKIGMKHQHESSETKASHFKWGWNKDTQEEKKNTAPEGDDVD
jgi:hypothetical protein